VLGGRTGFGGVEGEAGFGDHVDAFVGEFEVADVAVVEAFGTGAVVADVVGAPTFNNAGAEQQPTLTADMTEEEWDRIIAINLRSVFLCLKYEIPLMLEHGGGAIVNTSSGAGVKVFGRGAA
jgi:NAD(P)-dependent dehydrogenase (short-subunit alcohol dehydrogenase family)